MMSCRLVGLLILFALAGLARTEPQHDLPRHVNLIPDFQKFDLPPRAQGNRDTCSLFAITALAEFECARNSLPRTSGSRKSS